MRIGAGLETEGTVDDVVRRAKRLAASGVDSIWSAQIFGHDTMTVLAIAGRQVSSEFEGVEIGTAVVPVQPRHPMMLAAQGLTVQDACRGHFTLGIGLSHQMVVEGVWGLSFDRPVRYMREYLSILVPLLAGEQVSFAGDLMRTSTIGPLEVTSSTRVPVLVAALGSAMLRLTGELADGTVTWMTGVSTIDQHVVPTINAAAQKAGKRPPRVVVSAPICITASPDEARSEAAKTFAIYGHLPSYRAMLDREGVVGPADLAIVGDEEHVRSRIGTFEDAGATDLIGMLFGSSERRWRTAEFLGQLAKEP
jgi:5,10-methylenetetrahydromethanopterin reductase